MPESPARPPAPSSDARQGAGAAAGAGGVGSPLVYDAADRPSWRRAAWHLAATTLPVAFYTAAYAGTLYWVATFAVGEAASAATARRWAEVTGRPALLAAWWLVGHFLPVWVVFSWYGFWLRRSGYDAPLPRALEVLLTAILLLLPWFWPVRIVRHPRLVLRNYKRRFRGETLDFMDEGPGAG